MPQGVNPVILPGMSQAPGPYGSTTPNAGQTIQELVATILGLNQYQRSFQNMGGQAAGAAPAAELASMRAGVAPGAATALGGQSVAAAAPPPISTSAGLLDVAAADKVQQFQQRRLMEEYLRMMAANDPSFMEKYGSTIGVLLGAATGGLGLIGAGGAAAAGVGGNIGGAMGSLFGR